MPPQVCGCSCAEVKGAARSFIVKKEIITSSKNGGAVSVIFFPQIIAAYFSNSHFVLFLPS